jgi:hypothetical protein
MCRTQGATAHVSSTSTVKKTKTKRKGRERERELEKPHMVKIKAR